MPWENKRWLMGVSVHFYHLCLVQLFWSKLHTVSNKEKTGKQGWLRQNAHGSVCLFFLGTAHSVITSHPCTTRWKAWLLSDSLNIYILSAVASVFHQMIAWTQGWEIIYSTLAGPTWVKSSRQVMDNVDGVSHLSGCFCGTAVGIRSQLCWYISRDPSAPKFSHQSQGDSIITYHIRVRMDSSSSA